LQKWPRFADKMMSALSSIFSQAVKRGKMATNPAKGIDKAHKADPNANREWLSAEWTAATTNAPTETMIPLMLARYVGFRGQTIASVQWKNYQPDPRFGKCFRHVAKKNAEQSWVPVAPELQAYLDGLDRTSLNIATRSDGTPWTNEKEMQTAVSHYLRRLEKDGLMGAGTTLHGLRVSYAAELGRGGASDGDVAAALGDRSERMGKHYTRHVENEARVIRAFEGKKKP
jgi:integrase